MLNRLGFGLLRLLYRLLPLAWLGGLGAALGTLFRWVSAHRRGIVATNLRLCFPDMPEAARRALLARHFRAAGRAAILESVSWWGSRADIERLVRVEGEENLRAHQGKPLILLAPHFIGLNIGGIRLTTLVGTCVSMYSRIRNPVLDALMLGARSRFGESVLVSRADGIKPVLRGVKRGLPFYYLPDLDFGRKDAIFAPFFGVPAATVTALPRIAQATGAVVVPAITRWQDDHYVLRFYPPWENYPSGDVAADTRRMNAFIESVAREMPEQYFWLHQRFKTRPVGEASLYGEKLARRKRRRRSGKPGRPARGRGRRPPGGVGAGTVDDARLVPLDPGEVDALARLAREIWQASYADLISPAQIDYMLAQRYAPDVVRESLARGEFWQVARQGERMVGFAHGYPEEAGSFKLDKLYVHPDCQRQGLGGRLIAALAGHARQAGAARLVLRVNRGNARAIAAYRKHGFQVEREVDEDIGGGFIMADYLMTRPLHSTEQERNAP